VHVQQLLAAEVPGETQVFGHEPYTSAGRGVAHRTSEEPGSAPCGPGKTHQHLQGRRLARTIGPEVTEDLSGRHVQIKISEHRDGLSPEPVLLAQLFGTNRQHA
jgi:hypothetical protein